jgi:hypothetical protein
LRTLRAGDSDSKDGIPADAEIVAALRRKAGKGDVTAARELREWEGREERAHLAGDAWLAVLEPKERSLIVKPIERALARPKNQPRD